MDPTGLSSSDAITPTFGNTDGFYKPLVSSIPSTGNSLVDDFIGGVAGLANIPTAAMNFIAGDAFQATGNVATGKGTWNDGLTILAAVPLVKVQAKLTEGLVKVEQAVLKAVSSVDPAKGFESFSQAKKALGPAGEGNQWHHIVEQSQTKTTRAGFPSQLVQNPDNLVALDKTTHKQISALYSSKQPGTPMTVRDYLNTQTFDQQYSFGMKALTDLGVKK